MVCCIQNVLAYGEIWIEVDRWPNWIWWEQGAYNPPLILKTELSNCFVDEMLIITQVQYLQEPVDVRGVFYSDTAAPPFPAHWPSPPNSQQAHAANTKQTSFTNNIIRHLYQKYSFN